MWIVCGEASAPRGVRVIVSIGLARPYTARSFTSSATKPPSGTRRPLTSARTPSTRLSSATARKGLAIVQRSPSRSSRRERPSPRRASRARTRNDGIRTRSRSRHDSASRSTAEIALASTTSIPSEPADRTYRLSRVAANPPTSSDASGRFEPGPKRRIVRSGGARPYFAGGSRSVPASRTRSSILRFRARVSTRDGSAATSAGSTICQRFPGRLSKASRFGPPSISIRCTSSGRISQRPDRTRASDIRAASRSGTFA